MYWVPAQVELSGKDIPRIIEFAELFKSGLRDLRMVETKEDHSRDYKHHLAEK